jgi:hypothetical protein
MHPKRSPQQAKPQIPTQGQYSPLITAAEGHQDPSPMQVWSLTQQAFPAQGLSPPEQHSPDAPERQDSPRSQQAAP